MAADFDGDGLVDLYVGNPGDTSYVLRNTSTNGEMSFSEAVVFFEESLAWGAAAADYDNDGDPDLYVANGGTEGAGFDGMFKNVSEPGTIAFEQATREAGIRGPFDGGIDRPLSTPSANGVWADADLDGDLDLFVNTNVVLSSPDQGSLAGRNTLWINEGDGTFTDRTEFVGLGQTLRRTRHSAWIDFDQDGDFDLYENNFAASNVMWRNRLMEDGALSFEPYTAELSFLGADLALPNRSLAAVPADLNNDGLTDLIVFSRGDYGEDCINADPELFPIEGHHVFLNLGAGRGFVEVADLTGINRRKYDRVGEFSYIIGGLGNQVADLNADGLLDLFIGNGGPDGGERNHLFGGHAIEEMDLPGVGVVGVPTYVDWTELIDVAAEEDGEIPYPAYPYRSHGICAADFDGDGLLEVHISNGGDADYDDFVQEPNQLFDVRFAEQDRPHSFRVRLIGNGRTTPKDPVGAHVHVTARTADGETLDVHRSLFAGTGFSAQNGFDLFFGLGDAASIERLHIDWPGGGQTTITRGLELDARMVVTQP